MLFLVYGVERKMKALFFSNETDKIKILSDFLLWKNSENPLKYTEEQWVPSS